MNQWFASRWRHLGCLLSVWLSTSKAYANIPQPGKDLIPGKDNDFIDIFLAWFKKAGPLVVGVIGVAICIGAIAVLYKAFQRAQEREDLSIFWKHLLPTGMLIMMGIILLYLATQYYGS